MRKEKSSVERHYRMVTEPASECFDSSVFQLQSSTEELEVNPRWIRQTLRVQLSSNTNDTAFNQVLMNRFYHKYSASQDYYFSNHVNCILSEASVSPVVRYQDILTMLDEDEYLKRYYRVEEYSGKIQLLAEYYKFHRDIARVFTQPISHMLNKYHDARRKLDYQKIKQVLAEEAAKKNKRVAMNEDDNEIR